MRSQSLLTLSALAWAISSAAGCGFYEGGDHGDGRNRGSDEECKDDDGDDRGPRRRDASVVIVAPDATIPVQPTADSGVVVEPTPDAGTVVEPTPDAGTVVEPTPDAGTVVTPDAGACAPGQCACVRDNDCPDELVCDHAAGVCVTPPVRCADLTNEAACVAAATCQPVYAGQDCRDPSGGECNSGDTDCTCATFSFALCVDR